MEAETCLECYAKALRSAGASRIPMKFPMYVVPIAQAMAMTRMKYHEQLLAEGVLVLFDQRGKVMFVSHQWVSRDHPDPDFQQFRVLQEAIAGILSGRCAIMVEVNTEIRFGTKDKPSAKDFSSEPLFLWYDYFSCPQRARHLQQNAIDSIPAYVDASTFFVALTPTIETSTDVLNESSWSARGWCRVEQLARELSSQDSGMLMVPNAKRPEVNRMMSISIASPGEGAFSLEDDRARVASMLQAMFAQKLRAHLQKGDVVKYRLLLNQERYLFRGFDIEALDEVPGFVPSQADLEPKFLALERFMHRNGFGSIRERDAGGLSPFCYAGMHGDPLVVEALLDMKADPNDKIHKSVPSLSFPKNFRVLSLAPRFKNSVVVRLLIQAKANVNAGSKIILDTPLPSAAYSDDVESIKLLLDARADPHARDIFNSTALTFAAAGGAVRAVDELLRIPVELTSLHNPSIRSLEVVERLLVARANVDEIHKPPTIAALTMRAMRTKHQLSSVKTTFGTFAYYAHKVPPIFPFIALGRWEVVAMLIRAGARLDFKHSSGKTASDLAKELRAPDYVQEALQGEIGRCDSVVSKILSTRTSDSIELHVEDGSRHGKRDEPSSSIHGGFTIVVEGEDHFSI